MPIAPWRAAAKAGTDPQGLSPSDCWQRLDENLFLRMDRDDNRALLATAVTPSLDAGDLVLFHCRLFHAAKRNRTIETKFSPVSTYCAVDNPPLAGTESALAGDVALPVVTSGSVQPRSTRRPSASNRVNPSWRSTFLGAP